MKKICIVTATRAEYGLLKSLIVKLNNETSVELTLAVTGTHLSEAFGSTYQEIENDGFEIDARIPILTEEDTPRGISASMALALNGFAEYFAMRKPDWVLLLGDRYETVAIALAATNQRIPIIHLYGGETTEGALDESFRHALTKLSYLHFTSTEEYRQRVIQLGEDPSRVFCVGALGIENILNEKLLEKQETYDLLQIPKDIPYGMVTFHPATLDFTSGLTQIDAVLQVLENHPELYFIVTKANADAEGRAINQRLDAFALTHKNVNVFASLGVTRYLSGLKHAAFVLGNSSSGLIEAPSFKIPVINVGDRQKGRLRASCVIDCDVTTDAIEQALALARCESFKQIASATLNPYGNGDSSSKIIDVIKQIVSKDKIDLKKKFYDVEVKL